LQQRSSTKCCGTTGATNSGQHKCHSEARSDKNTGIQWFKGEKRKDITSAPELTGVMSRMTGMTQQHLPISNSLYDLKLKTG
jgi:hypothetical protein